MDFRDEQHMGQHVYGVNAKTEQAAEDENASVALEFTGADADGRVIAEGNLLISVDAMADSTAFLGQTLDGIGALCGVRPRSRAGPRVRGRAPNSGQRWDTASVEELRQRWMRSSPPTTGYALTGELAETFGRSRSSIRAQLARLGCDPDVPGRCLTDVSAGEGAILTEQGDSARDVGELDGSEQDGGAPQEAVTVGMWEFQRK